MGRYWLQASDPGHIFYVNWRTGERVDVEVPPGERSAPNRDIDSPDLATLVGIPFKSWALFGHEHGLSAVRPYNDPGARSFAGPLQLVAPHRRHVVSRAPCLDDCGAVSHFAGGRIDWVEPTNQKRRIRSYSIHTRSYSTWNVRGIPDPGRPLHRVVPGHTARFVIFAVLARLKPDPYNPGNETADLYKIYAARP
jgi:hypothetical protein